MKKNVHTYHLLFCFLLLVVGSSIAQTGTTGVNILESKASLHIEANNNVNPESGAGILIPRLNTFPSVNPSALQYGMLVFRPITTGSGFEGFYYWDAPNDTWEYIITSEILDLDLNKHVASGTSFETNIASGNTNYVRAPLTIIDSPKASYSLDSNGDIVIGQSGSFYISVTGGVNKPHTGQNLAETISTAVFVNGTINNNLVSNTVFPSVLLDARSVTFAISRIVTLQAGDVLSVRTQRGSTTQLGTLTVNSPFTIILSYLE